MSRYAKLVKLSELTDMMSEKDFADEVKSLEIGDHYTPNYDEELGDSKWVSKADSKMSPAHGVKCMTWMGDRIGYRFYDVQPTVYMDSKGDYYVDEEGHNAFFEF